MMRCNQTSEICPNSLSFAVLLSFDILVAISRIYILDYSFPVKDDR